MSNNRIFYAVEQVGIAPLGSTAFTAINGVQSAGVTTSFNLEHAFELGQIDLYQNIENLPEVEVSLTKFLDGYCPMLLLATQGANSATLNGRANLQCGLAMSIFSDQQNAASGSPISQFFASGMIWSQSSFEQTVDGNGTETLTLIGQNKVWGTGLFTFTGGFSSDTAPIAPDGIARRQHFKFDSAAATLLSNGQVNDLHSTILPPDIAGISSSGTNDRNADGSFKCHIQNAQANVNVGRATLFELGNKPYYFRYAEYPVQVNAEFTVIALSGDVCQAIATGNNTTDRQINLCWTEGTKVDLGPKNRLMSVNAGGGDANGGNMTLTYNFQTFNWYSVYHSGDVTVGLRM